ncbi:MAG: septum formation inhibitor Maf [Firmicutes bacterium]|nr:septum formation inhibitor Maf [Bacillota bacterium]
MKKLILASASPRRAELLRQVGIPFNLVIPEICEQVSEQLTPEELVSTLARKKAESVVATVDRGLVLAADTLVYYRGLILGKPGDAEEAGRMLQLISGARHEVITALHLVDAESGRIESGISSTKVWMKELTALEIAAYLATGEPYDKAGAYGIQGRAALFISRIEGCYFNVVGLPLSLLQELLNNMNFTTWLNGDDLGDAK